MCSLVPLSRWSTNGRVITSNASSNYLRNVYMVGVLVTREDHLPRLLLLLLFRTCSPFSVSPSTSFSPTHIFVSCFLKSSCTFSPAMSSFFSSLAALSTVLCPFPYVISHLFIFLISHLTVFANISLSVLLFCSFFSSSFHLFSIWRAIYFSHTHALAPPSFSLYLCISSHPQHLSHHCSFPPSSSSLVLTFLSFFSSHIC